MFVQIIIIIYIIKLYETATLNKYCLLFCRIYYLYKSTNWKLQLIEFIRSLTEIIIMRQGASYIKQYNTLTFKEYRWFQLQQSKKSFKKCQTVSKEPIIVISTTKTANTRTIVSNCHQIIRIY